MFFLAQQILTGELICTDFCAILFTNQLEKKTKQCSSPGVHRGAWCFTVERGASPCSVVLASRRQLQHTCDGPESPPHFPAGTGLPPGHPGQGSPHFREQATCKQVQDSQNLGGAQLYISCDVTKTRGKCRLTDVFQSTLGFSFVSVIVVAKSAPPRAQSENCFYYKSPEMRTSATVFITHLIK